MVFNFTYNLLRRTQIEVPASAEPYCPTVGHHPFAGEPCGPTFVKCALNADTAQIEPTMFRCPAGYSYWRVSRRCERTEKLLANNCSTSGRLLQRQLAAEADNFPVEWINLGRARKLRL